MSDTNQEVKSTQAEETPTPDSSRKKNRKLWILPLLLLLAVIFAGGGYLLGYHIGKEQSTPANVKASPTVVAANETTPGAENGEKTPTDVPPTDGAEPTEGADASVTPNPEAPTEGLTPTAAVSAPATGTPSKKPTATPAKKPTSKPTATPTKAVTVEKGTPVANHGKLSVKGTKLVDKNGDVYQLRGVSTHGLQWFPQYVNKAAFQTLRDEWNCNVVRLAMYTAEGGYCEGADKTKLKKLVKSGVDYATELGMYVIIDWHVLNDRDPNKYKSEAIKFFEEMAKAYKDNVNVIYEICNEPNGGVGWSSIKSYANDVIKAIRAIDKDAVIIVGTPNWSQQVDQAAANPITGQKNIMYAIHFYAGTHKDDLRNTMIRAVKAGLPVFCSEFGITDASGNGNLDEASANKWIAVMDELDISYVCWNLANKNESSSLIKSGCNKTAGWSESELSGQAKWLIKVLKGTLEGLGKIDAGEIVENAGEGGNGGNGGGGGAAANPAPISFEKKVGGWKVGIASTNTWASEKGSCYQIGPSLTNETGKAVSTWKLTITFDKEVAVDQFWGCKVTVSGKTMTVTPEDYTASVENGATMSNCGIIFSAKSAVKIKSVTCQ